MSNKLLCLIPFVLMVSCNSNTGSKVDDSVKRKNIATDTFEKATYLKIDKVYSGNVFIGADGKDCFYRVLEVPEEENTMLIAEKISIGEESGKYNLLKRIMLSGKDAPLGYAANANSSVTFIDSVTIKVNASLYI